MLRRLQNINFGMTNLREVKNFVYNVRILKIQHQNK